MYVSDLPLLTVFTKDRMPLATIAALIVAYAVDESVINSPAVSESVTVKR